MADHVLTLRQLNRTLLARQMLLERAPLAAAEATARLAGLQAQSANAPYIGLWTRLRDFQRDELTGCLERHAIVRATLMRATLHLVTAADYLAFRPALQPALTRSLRGFFGKRAQQVAITPLIEAGRAGAEERPRTFAELRAALVALDPAADPALVAYAVRMHLPLVQVPPGGTWGWGGNPAHTTAAAWLGQPLASAESGLRRLVSRYLAAFGPASINDMQAWSGLTGLRATLAALDPPLRIYRDEAGRELFDLPELALTAADAPAPPRFLPEFDNLLLAHADRSRVIADAYRAAVYLTVGRVRATILVDGFVAGTWQIERERETATLVIEPLQALAPATRAALAEEGVRLVRFVADGMREVAVRFAER